MHTHQQLLPRRLSALRAASLGLALLAAACSTSSAVRTASTNGTRAGTIVASNMVDHTATLIDAADASVIATLPTGTGPHEVAVSHDGRWAVVSNYGAGREPGNSLTVIDLMSAQVSRTIDLGEYRRPHGMSFLPGDSTLVITSEANRALVLLAFPSGTVRRVVPTRGRASHMVAVAAGGDRAVVANIADATITLVSLTGSPDSITISVPRQPEGIAITPDGSEAWVGSNRDSVVTVVDLNRRNPVATLRGFGLPYRIAISRDGRRAVITDPALGVARIVDAKTRTDIATITFPRDSILASAEIPGSPSPEGVTISPDSRWAFVTLQGLNRVAIIDLAFAAIVGYAPTGNWSDGVGYSPITRPRTP
jgi:DNA-binding beta-propeller fold protein YncE